MSYKGVSIRDDSEDTKSIFSKQPDGSSYARLPEGKQIDATEFGELISHNQIGAIEYRYPMVGKKEPRGVNLKIFYFREYTLGVAIGYGFSTKFKRFNTFFYRVGTEIEWENYRRGQISSEANSTNLT